MAIGDFMHKQLVSAAGRDALTSMGAGAGIGAALGASSALVTGNDSMMGGAMSGAMLGAGGGAAMRYAGAKYGSGLMAAKAAGEDIGTGLQTTMFTRAVKGTDPQMSFMGSAEDAGNMKGFAEAAAQQSAAKAATKGAGAANATENAQGAAVKTPNPSKNITKEAQDMVNEGNAKDVIDATKKLREEQNAARTSYQTAPTINQRQSGTGRGYRDRSTQNAMARADEYNNYQKALGSAEASNPSVTGQDRMTTSEINNILDAQKAYQTAPTLNQRPSGTGRGYEKRAIAKNAAKIREPGYTSKQEINREWDYLETQKQSQMDDMWNSIGL